MNFTGYAKYYDLLYGDKDYVSEARYAQSLIEKFGAGSRRSILDIGCGTGRHAEYLSGLGYEVDGIDRSREMISIAESRSISRCHFKVGDATTFVSEKKYDVVLSLFHVLSYQTKNEDVELMLTNAGQSVRRGGLVLFDFWYGPAVLTEKPSTRVKTVESDGLVIQRVARGHLREDQNIVDVEIDVLALNHATHSYERLNEVHPMRYFFIPELDFFLSKVGLQSKAYFAWESQDPPSPSSWSASCVAVKVS
ncbi:MAG TPA: class I SAM-dependent methyltransferase [Candidatus Acidoferrales bacterium]|nr:class I SAM-dependent methyltransferase [Candidatus Acidoferrales bacterium]